MKAHDDCFFFLSATNKQFDLRISFRYVYRAYHRIAGRFQKASAPHINAAAIWRSSVLQKSIIYWVKKIKTRMLCPFPPVNDYF